MAVRTVSFDDTNIQEMLKLRHKLNSFIGAERNKDENHVSSKQHNRNKFYAIMNIIEHDISSVYNDIELSDDKKYYVYAHCSAIDTFNPRTKATDIFSASKGCISRPFYIGKGTGNRAYDLNRNGEHRKIRQKLKEFGKNIDVCIIEDNLTEKEALCLESKLIDIYGLKSKGGYLVNLDEGVKSEERRMFYSEDLINISKYYENKYKKIVDTE